MNCVASVRPATIGDIDFVSQDGQLASDIVGRKISCNEVLVAEVDGVLAGYVRIEYLWSSVPYLGLIHVVPDCRGQGVGRALLAALRDRFLAEGHRAFYSSSQADEVEPQTWHRHMGFVECGVLTGVNPGDVDELFYRKTF